MADGKQFDQRGSHVHGHQVNIGEMRGNIGQVGDTYVLPGREYRVPFQLPPRPAHFTGRAEVVAALKAQLTPGQDITLHGPGGIGKTALAAEAMWQLQEAGVLQERFPDGVLFFSFEQRPASDDALGHIALSLGEENMAPAPIDAARRALAGRQLLLVLDGAEQADRLDRVRAVAGGCAILVATRDRRQAKEVIHNLGPLPPADALALLQGWAAGYAAEEGAARKICELVGGLPLALRLAGRYLAQQAEPAGSYLEWLQQTPLAALDHGQRREESVPILLEKSVAQVAPRARQIVALAGRLSPKPIPAAALAAALGHKNLHDLRRPLAELVGHGLLRREDDSYELAHALIHTYAARRLAVEPEMLARLAGYYQALVAEASAGGAPAYLTLFSAYPHMLALLPHLQAAEQWEPLLALAAAVDGHLEGRSDSAGRLATAVLTASEGIIRQINPLAGLVAGLLAPVASSGTRFLFDRFTAGDRLAVAEMGLAAARASGGRAEEAAWLEKVGDALHGRGRVEEAVARYREASGIYEALGQQAAQAALLGKLGSAYQTLGQMEAAVDSYEAALAIRRERGEREGEGKLLLEAGRVLQLAGKTERALTYAEAALALLEELGSPEVEAARAALALWGE